jgi:hypothetical protein
VADLGCNGVARFPFDFGSGSFDNSKAEFLTFHEHAG